MGSTPTYHYTDKSTGKSIRFRWSGSKPPQDEDIDRMFKEQDEWEKNQEKLKQSSREEKTHEHITSGLGTSVDQWIEQHPSLAQAMQNHPYLSAIAEGPVEAISDIGKVFT